MRISKDMARQISFRLTDKGRAKVENLKKEWQKAVTLAYIQQTPEKIIKTKAQYPEWFQMTDSITLDGHGFSWTNVAATERVIKDSKGNSFLKLNAKLSGDLKVLQTAWHNAKQSNEKLQQETENAILALGTYKQIIEKFPDAAQYLPNVGPKSMALIPNLDGLKAKLQKQ
jgi:DNA-binding MarR family transcriptional regulator